MAITSGRTRSRSRPPRATWYWLVFFWKRGWLKARYALPPLIHVHVGVVRVRACACVRARVCACVYVCPRARVLVCLCARAHAHKFGRRSEVERPAETMGKPIGKHGANLGKPMPFWGKPTRGRLEEGENPVEKMGRAPPCNTGQVPLL